ncbi:MAG: S8 family peptidase [Pseudomonadota bacterium]
MSALLAAGLSALGAQAALPAGAPTKAVSGGTDQIIIKYREDGQKMEGLDTGISSAAMGLAQAAAERHGVTLRVARRTATRAIVAKLGQRLPEAQVEQIAAEIAQADPSVLYAEPDRIKRIMVTPNDPMFANQWHYHEATAGMNLPLAWSQGAGGGVTVAVIDTGYRGHADLRGNIVPGYDFISDLAVANDGDARDGNAADPGDWTEAGECGGGSGASNSSWHGTHVAGTVAAVTHNGVGVAGVAYGAKVMPVRVLGKCGGYDSDIADAIIWASGGSVAGVPNTTTPARVLNLSLGGSGPCGATTQAAVNSARSRKSVVVVAAGNSGDDASGYSPANCSGVITVAAVGRTADRAYYSNYGSAVEIAAPGGDQSWSETDGVLSTSNAGLTTPKADSYAYYQGTSMASPHVAGAVALMLSKNLNLTPDQVLGRLRASTKPFYCSGCGSGTVDAYEAIRSATATAVTEVEANNTYATAQVIAPTNAVVSGSISSVSDLDIYKVVVQPGHWLIASMAPWSNASDFDLYLVSTSGSVLAKSEKSAGLTDRVTYKNNKAVAVTLYLRLVYYSTTGSYTMNVRH